MSNLKKDFPIFENQDNLIYLDNCSTTQKPKIVIDGIVEHLSKGNANIHRGLYNISDISQDFYDNSKKIIANSFGVLPSEIIYTYNSTYAFNLLAYSLYFSGKIKSGDKILLSIAEHHSNIVPWFILRDKFGIEVDFVNLDDNGDIDFNDFHSKYTENVKLVSFTYVSNVTGTIFDIKSISKILRPDTLFAVDGSQAVPNFPVDINDLGLDFFVFTGHKIMANTGIGVLFIKKDILKTLTSGFGGGGSIDNVDVCGFKPSRGVEGFEMGTPNISGAVSLLKAFEYIQSIGGFSSVWQKEQNLTKYMLKGFLDRSDKIELIGKKTSDNRVGVFSFIIKGDFSPIRFGEYMASKNICIRCGGHCAHPYLESMGYKGSCRASIYVYNDENDIDVFFKYIDEYLKNN